ncbi:MAG TPA: hypothetical protein VMU92_08700 [Acidobacteriaceae bacterium]|nr:hypothetical protein [Acidobacteriaceae bacterium]
MHQTQSQSAPLQSDLRHQSGESIYQIAIVIAAFLLVISASLF